MTAFEFSKHAITVCAECRFVQGIEIQLLDEPVAKLKAVIDDGSFIGIFYNAETGKFSFALIRNGKRIFGADNTRNWHMHPFEDPDSHIETKAVSLSEFLEMVESFRKRQD